ncbi:hypothetical protein C1C94_0029885 [Streptomyces sp. SMS_SU21]|nr:hypothetical protein [Streptomyces sp. SMS_SU21]MCA2204923.1 hypothetical protein [Streptomyces sp. SMS_SU21]
MRDAGTAQSAAATLNVSLEGAGAGGAPGILAMGGARGSATLTNVTITGSAEGDVLIEPGSAFVINR